MTPFTVSTVCFRRYPLEQALDTAARLGFDRVDLVGLRGLCEHVPVNGTLSEMRRAARQFAASRLQAASVNADPGSFDGADDIEQVMARVRRLLAFCQEAGVPLLVLPCGEKREDASAPPRYAAMADALNEVAVMAWHEGIRLAVEAPYFGRPVDTIGRTETLLELLDPDVDLAFDVSHVVGAGESVTDAWAAIHERIAIIHLRDAVAGDIRRVIGHGDVDFPALLQAAQVSGFDGDVVLELETRNSPYQSKEDEVRAALAQLGPVHAPSVI
ncbi:sugar phosphate isomerase/epimerase [Microbacterium sp. AZCO]|uniref:sugar phosphate isomerase/epimerase family protein n=1 Tax=Microbacterium sp. AZCO TaxID=3142976 RepID=UPI0031F36CEC